MKNGMDIGFYRGLVEILGMDKAFSVRLASDGGDLMRLHGCSIITLVVSIFYSIIPIQPQYIP